jgi:iron(III) transport system substrate-binding protein
MKSKLAGLLVSALTGFALCSSATAQTNAEWQKVVQAAKKEGKVALYAAGIGVRVHKEIGLAFEKKYGIRFEILEARASELRERIRTEQAAGRFTGDVQLNGYSVTSLMVKDGSFQPLGTLPNAKNLLPQFAAHEYSIPLYKVLYGILINSELVKPADEPKSWKDLLNPRWKGKILSDDTRALGGGSVFFMVMYDTFGTEFHEKLAAQGPMFTRDMGNAERRVAQEEYPLYSPEVLNFYTQLKGLPVKYIVPKEGSPYIRFDLALLKNAPHPNAARLLINYFLETETQLVLANQGIGPTVKGVIEHANPELREMLNAKLLGTTVPERQNEMLELARKIYK